MYCQIDRFKKSRFPVTYVNPSAIELPSIPKDATNNATDLYL